MTAEGPSQARDPLQTLLDRVEGERERRCREILDQARTEADRIRAEAYRQARDRFHEAAETDRQRVAERLRSARAEQETRRRQRRHQRINADLAEAWGLIGDALERRWRDPEARKQWMAAALRQAGDFLPGGTWQVEHPPDLDPAEIPVDRADTVDPGEITLEPRRRPELTAGLRIRRDGAVVDATPAGLLADGSRVRSWLLAEVRELQDGGETG